MLASVLFGLGLSATFLAVVFGVGQGAWLLVRGWRPVLAGSSWLGAALVVLAYIRQYQLDARVDVSGGRGGWDAAFLPLCLGGLALVVITAWAAAAGPRAVSSARLKRSKP